MIYLGIDQHARQLTISLRDDQGDVVQARQVSTLPEKIQEFFERLKRDFLRDGESLLAVVEVCGFNDWLRLALGDQSPNTFEALSKPTLPRHLRRKQRPPPLVSETLGPAHFQSLA